MSKKKLANVGNKTFLSLLACLLALHSPHAAGQSVGEIHLKSGATLENTYVWDGTELAPKAGASFSSTWTFDGSEVRPKSGASFDNTYEWDGEELRPKSGADFSNTYVWDGRELEPKSGASFQNTWTFDGEEGAEKRRIVQRDLGGRGTRPGAGRGTRRARKSRPVARESTVGRKLKGHEQSLRRYHQPRHLSHKPPFLKRSETAHPNPPEWR
jgi:hypothetical protein